MTRNEAIFQLNATVDHIRGDVAYDANGDVVTVDLAAAQTLADSKAYVEQRVLEYPTIGDQLDALYHAGVFPDDMAAQIQAVKNKYPKG
jgi:hypothetical protein